MQRKTSFFPCIHLYKYPNILTLYAARFNVIFRFNRNRILKLSITKLPTSYVNGHFNLKIAKY